MGRPRKRAAAPQLTAGQASYVLDRLVRDRRISSGEVSRYVTEMHREISELELRLDALKQASGGSTAPARGRRGGRRAAAAPASGEGSARPAKRRRRSKVTAEQKASRQVQGRYLGLIRQIPASKRAQYQKTAKDKGREAAIKDMAAALNK